MTAAGTMALALSFSLTGHASSTSAPVLHVMLDCDPRDGGGRLARHAARRGDDRPALGARCFPSSGARTPPRELDQRLLDVRAALRGDARGDGRRAGVVASADAFLRSGKRTTDRRCSASSS